jgi:predicted amidohydrolase YtcJ
MKLLSRLAVVWLVAAPLLAQSPRADLVLTNGVVYTMDAKRPTAQAIAVAGNRIVAVGTSDEVAKLQAPNATLIDLKGATVIPGFKESHAHFLGIGQQKLNVNLVGTKSYQEIVDKIAAAARAAKPGEWVIGRGWHQDKWDDKSVLSVRGFPTHHALSAVSPNNPVSLRRADGHAVFANAKAMELMKVGKDTQPPQGGEIIKDKDGNPTGIFVDRAMGLIKVPPPTADQERRALELAMQECLQKGITAVDDAGVGLDTVALYKEYASGGKLNLRLNVMIRGLDNVRRFAKPETGLGRGFLNFRSVKLSSDGALGSRGAALLEPYVDDKGNSGFFTTQPAEVLETARFCLQNGFQLNVHAIGDRANRMVLDQFEKAFKEFPNVKEPRFRIEHAQILDEQDIPRFAKLGVIASMQGIHATSDLPWAGERLGAARVAEGGYVWQKLLKSGARVVNGTDAPVEDVDAIKSFYASVTRQDEQGRPKGGFSPDQKLSREEALRSYTLDAAYGSFAEKDLGSIEAGKLADFTVLSKDILKVPDAEILKAEVLYTIVDGKVRYRKAPLP